jgi:hypothetical protein
LIIWNIERSETLHDASASQIFDRFSKDFLRFDFVFLLLAGQSSNEFGSAPALFVGSARSASLCFVLFVFFDV